MRTEFAEFIRTRKKLNLLIIAANIAVFLLMELLGGDTLDVEYMVGHGAMYVPAVTQAGEYYRLFTAMFLHFGAEHLLYNMLLLLFAGDMLQRRTGAARYLLIYLGGGFLGNLLSLMVNVAQGAQNVSAGASGAVFAVIGGLVWIVLKSRGRAEGINGRGVCAMALLSLAQGITDAGVDNYAHLGGFIGGFLLAAISEILWGLSEKHR